MSLKRPIELAEYDYCRICNDPNSWDTVVASYRNYYNKSKSRFATFGKYGNETPYWYRNEYVTIQTL